MKKVILICLLCLGYYSNAQLWTPSQAWGNSFKRLAVTEGDTTSTKLSGALTVKSGVLYIANGSYWSMVTGSGGTTDSLVFATWKRLYKVNDSMKVVYNNLYVKYTDSITKYVTPTQLLSTIQSQAANFSQNSYTYTATGGETTFSNSVLVNQVVMGVVRDGNSYLPTTSSPDSISAQYVAGTGTINFNVGIIAGVKVRVLYQPLAGSYNNYASIRYVDTYADMETQLSGTTPLIFYVLADEENGGGTPAMYLYNNSILIRLIPQQAN